MATVEELLVFGYVRRLDGYLSKIVPKSITNVCYEFYAVKDYFEIAGKGIKIEKDDSMITKQENAKENYSNTSYGTKLIDSSQNVIAEWTLKIVKNRIKGLGICIGIANNSNYQNKQSFHCGHKSVENNIYYIYHNERHAYQSGDISSKYGKDYGTNDIIKLELNLKESKIEFYVNGESQGILSKDIKRNDETKYRLQISMFFRNDSIEILDFKQTKC